MRGVPRDARIASDARVLDLADLDRASDNVSLALRHIRRWVPRIRCARPVRAVNRSLEGATEHRSLPRLNPFEHDLVGLDEVVDIDSQVPCSSVADQLWVSRAARSSDQRRLGQPDRRTRTRTPAQPSGSGSPRE
jgi:hypothetical protein